MRSTVTRIGMAAAMVAALGTAACGGNQSQGSTNTVATGSANKCAVDSDTRIGIATGNATGVYYTLGNALAEQISNTSGGKLKATAAETGASVQNIQQLAKGDYQVAFSLFDTASDAVQGKGAFAEGGPQKIKALARIYDNVTHVVVRVDANINTVAELKGKRVSTGSPKSGTEVIANRVLTAAGLNPETDISAQRLDLTKTVDGIKGGTVDALFWSGGLPTPGVTDLLSQSPGQFEFLPLDQLLEPLTAKYGNVYSAATIPAKQYGTGADVSSIAVANLILVSPSMPDAVARDLTRVLYEYQPELVKAHPEGKNFDRTSGAQTDPVPLHPGARAYYASATVPTGPATKPTR